MASSTSKISNWDKFSGTLLRAKYDIPYVENGNALQKLDIYVPESSCLEEIISEEQHNRYWIVFIHGGAWRDPKITKSAFQPAIRHFMASGSKVDSIKHVAGFASINYTLSGGEDQSRRGQHPDHIRDVIQGLAFLLDFAKDGGLPSDKYIVLGHSCGATLAYQVAMDHSLWTAEAALPDIGKPDAVVGFEGLYDLELLENVKDPAYLHLQPIYREFLAQAFGSDKRALKTVSPTGGDFAASWPNGRVAALAQSRADSLVSWEQTNAMKKVLDESWAGAETNARTVWIKEVFGDHDDTWKDGNDIAKVIIDILQSLVKIHGNTV